jgi:hypothetical protein
VSPDVAAADADADGLAGVEGALTDWSAAG